MSPRKSLASNKTGPVSSLLDLPKPALDYILLRLLPADLSRMAKVCSLSRDRCRSDHLWEKQLRSKWGKVIGDAALKEWKWHIQVRKSENFFNQCNLSGSIGSLSGSWPLLLIGSYLENCEQSNTSPPDDSIMALYVALESGRFWFPAQVYRSGGLMFYCYDALLSYHSGTNTFRARLRHGGWRATEDHIGWDRVRETPVQTPPSVHHVSDCLNDDDLKPGHHIEIQWRASKEFPFDWWYAVIGHLDACDMRESHCRCHRSALQSISFSLPCISDGCTCVGPEMLIVEFRQYSATSIYRRIVYNKREVGEQSIRGGGYYGGIRKLRDHEEIEKWRSLLPRQTSEFLP